MNHIYRLVWNDCTGTWVAVAENARSRGKGSGRAARKAFLCALIASGFSISSAMAELPATTVIPASGKTNAYISANGVPVVNIETANAAGLSHNFYTSYNVEANGLVLNNGNNSQVARQSQLAGQVIANLNLVNEARIILNEVVSTSRSTLAGFTEVLGGRADVVVANPNGITCNGCGFINTDRVTLTSGTPNIAGMGSLAGFTVNRGDVLIEGIGANANAQQIFDIVARSVKVDGKINTIAGGSLGIATGNNIWDYTSRNVTGSVAGAGVAPSYALDSTVLGGMYAGRIRIVATEAGVGVRMLGEAAASADDFTLTSAGKIEIQSAISAARDTSITTTSASGNQDLLLNGATAKLSASRDLALFATSGQIKLSEGELYAANNLTLTGATLSDVSTAAKTRFAGVNNTLVTMGAAVIDGGVWGAGSALSGTFDSLAIGAGGTTIYAGATLGLSTVNDLSLATAAVRSAGDMTLAASLGAISTANGAAQGIQATAGNLSLTAGNGLSNAGTITSDAGSVTTRINGALTNSGTLHAKTTLDIADKANGSTENITNSGTLIADGSITSKAASFTNQVGATVQAATGATLTATALNNAGTFIASNTAGQSGAFTLASLSNSGTIQSIENLVFNVSGTLDNTGKLLATTNLTVNAGASALAMTNTNPGVIQAGNTLTITGSNATFNTQSGTVLGNTVAATLANLDNSGTLQSNAAMTLAIGNGLSNSGTVLAKTSLTSNSASLSNSGTLQANTGSTITAGALTNSGTLIASNTASNSATLNVATLSNSGTIQSAKDLSVNLSGASLGNTSKIIANNNLTLTSTGSGLAVANQSGGYLQAGSTTGDALTISGTAVVLNNSAGSNTLGDKLDFTLTGLTNSGTIQGGSGDSVINLGVGAVSNAGTLNLASTGSGTITADTINNSGTLQSQGAAALNLASVLTNSGSLLTAGALTVRGTDSYYTVSDTGRIQSGGLMDVKGINGGNGVDITVGGGAVMLGDSMDVNAGVLTVNDGGMVSSTGNMNIAANTLSFGGTTSRIVAANSGTGNATITLANAYSNIGAVHSSGDMTFNAPSIFNTSTGGFSALHSLTVQAQGGNLDNAGALYAGTQLNAGAVGNLTNYSPTGTMDSGGSMSLAAGSTFTNNSTINATQDITISAPTFRNEIPGGAPTRSWSGVIVDPGSFMTGEGGDNHYWTQYIHLSESFVNPPTATKPQIIAGRNMNISSFSSAFNTGAVLSANSGTMTITGTGAFTNDDLSLETRYFTRTWIDRLRSSNWTYFADLLDVFTSATTSRSYGAGIFARTLNATGFSLVNQSSTSPAAPKPRNEVGASGASLSGSVSGAALGSGVLGTTSVTAASAISFGGLTITLPTNPNGYFVISRNSTAQFLVETNPLFSVGSNFVGTDYMDKRYGYNPDTVIKRLGDSNYEAYLIRQQLIEQAGNNVIKGYGDEAAQMQRLMDQALDQGKNLGLIYGKQLTPGQIAGLKQDIVWMEEVEVAGQKVLAPRVYLAQSTRDMITGGAVIAGDNVNLDVTSLGNTGGSILGGDTLKIVSKGDITNTSGTIGGGKVSLKSTEGSIKNETVTHGSGNSEHFATVIGKTAGITATGDLEMDAKKDISVKGGDVKAGGDASLSAGGNITFDTIVNKSTDTTKESHDGGVFGTSTSSSTTTSNEKNIGSNLASGGKLKLKSGGNTTIAGSAVQADGGLDVDAGGSFLVLARQDKTTTKTTSEKSGFGVGGGVYGSEKTTTDNFKGTNKGSTIQVGKAEDQETRVAALQELRDKNTVLSATTDALLALKKELKNAKPGSPEAAELKEKFNAGLATYRSQLEESKELQAQIDALPSGDLNVKAGKSMVLQGSELNVAGNADIDAKEGVDILDGLDEERTTTTTTTSTFLKMDGDGGEAKSGKESETKAKLSTASASTGASAEASSDDNFKISETTTTKTNSGSKTSIASSLNVGGNLKAKSDGAINIIGSNITAGGDLSLDAKDINVLAGRNEEFSDTSTTTTSTGFYEQSGADASAEAGAKASGAKASANANASAEANAETTLTIGARTEESKESSYNLTNSKSSIKAGGNMDMKAANRALFVGAEIESGGDMTIEAKDIVNLAARDISTSESSSSQTTAGLYVGAEANAGGSAETRAGAHVTGTGVKPLSGAVSGEASTEASAGVRFSQESEKESESTVTNVTNTFKAGGNFKRTATNVILDEGTTIEAGGNIEQSARVITENAIHDTTSESSSTDSHDARVGVYAGAEASGGADTQGKVEAPDADAAYGVKASYKGGSSDESKNSSTAVTSKYKAGGSITSKSTEKTTLVGTLFEAGKDVDIEAGSLDYQAARDSESSTSSSNEIDASGKVALGGTKMGGSAEASFGKEGESEKSSTAQRGSINAGGNVRIKTTQGDANFEGTKIEGKDNVSVDSAGDVNFKAAYDTSESSSNSVNASASLEIGKGGEAEGGVSGGYSQSNDSGKTAQVGGINGNNISVKAANDVNMEGTKLKSQSDTSIEAGNNVNLKAVENTETSTSFGVDASFSASNEAQNGKLGVNAGYSTQVSSETTRIDSGGKLSIKGKTITNQEAELTAQEGKSITGKVVNEKAANYGFEVGLDVSASQGGSKSTEGANATDGAKPADGAKPDATPKAEVDGA